MIKKGKELKQLLKKIIREKKRFLKKMIGYTQI